MNKYVLREIKGLGLAVRDYSNHSIFSSINTSNITQMYIMFYLFTNLGREVNQKELEMFTNLRRATVSGVLDTMEKNGLIVRLPDGNDGRKKIIKLTNKCDDGVILAMREFDAILTKDISKDKLNVFFDVIDMMKENLKEER